MEPVNIGLVGAVGFGRSHLASIRRLAKEGMATLGGVVVIDLEEAADAVAEFEAEGVPIYPTLDAMLDAARAELDLIALPVGIPSHRDLMIASVEAGLDVILEKPPAATVQDVDAMQVAFDRTGRFCQIGFQSQSNPRVLALKRALCERRIGRVKEVVVTALWRRAESYYARNNWAGALKLGGQYVLDGTINNPQAHYLFNGLYFASDEPRRAAVPRTVRAELYRGHRIESEDTSCLEIACENGVKVRFYGTLCARRNSSPVIDIIGEEGEARYNVVEPPVLLRGGEEIARLEPDEQGAEDEVFRNAIRYLRGLDEALNSPLEMTRPHTLAVNGAFESAHAAGGPLPIPDDALSVYEEEYQGVAGTFTHLRGIEELIDRAAAGRRLFSDLAVPWARATRAVSLEGYTTFEL